MSWRDTLAASQEEPMRVLAMVPAAMVLGALTACSGPQVGADFVDGDSVPKTVDCEDARDLSNRATEDRRRVDESHSDHERIVVGSRSNFLASLAVVASLRCKVTMPEVDEAVEGALSAARGAAAASGVYEKTRGFNDATFHATRVAELMTARIASPK
jgi:hypothetical protein